MVDRDTNAEDYGGNHPIDVKAYYDKIINL